MMKLVIVEDEDIIREGLISYIDWNKLGYEVVGEAMNGKQGLEIVREKNPDVILTDIRMPVMDGLQMLQELRNENNDTSAVILSGYEDFEYARSAMKLGVSDYILKPLNIRKLEEVMGRIYQEHSTKKERNAEYQRLKSWENYNRLQAQKNLFEMVILQGDMGQVNGRIREEAEELYFTVLIISQEGFPVVELNYDYLQLADADREFQEDVQSVVRNFENTICVRVSMGERVICQWNQEKEVLRKMNQSLQKELEEKYGNKKHMHICSGKVGYGLEGLRHVYQGVREKQQMEYRKVLDDIVRVESSREGSFRYMSYDATNLLVEVRTGSYDAIDRELDYFEMEMEKQNVSSHMHVMLLVSNLYAELMKLPEEVSSTAEEVLGDPMEYYRKIVTNTDRKDIVNYLKDVCHIFNDFFKNINQGKFDSILKRAKEFMQKEYMNPTLQIKDVAKAAYVSNSYLSVIIKQGTGKTFVEYLTELRMEQAKKLLEETELKNYEIAELCGFSNPTYFSTVFKSAYGIAPSAYKKENKKL